MRTEQEIREKIMEIENNYAHVLTGSLATLGINAPRALMQLTAVVQIDTLYYVLGEKRTKKYEFEEKLI